MVVRTLAGLNSRDKTAMVIKMATVIGYLLLLVNFWRNRVFWVGYRPVLRSQRKETLLCRAMRGWTLRKRI